MSVESSDEHNHVDEAFHVPTSSELTVVKKKNKSGASQTKNIQGRKEIFKI